MRSRYVYKYVAAFLLFLCPAGFGTGAKGEDRPVLHVFTWENYFDSNVVNAFQIKYDCEVALDYYDSNDLVVKALELDSGGYDVVTPSGAVSTVMRRRGMLLGLDHAKLPNLPNVDRTSHALVADPEMIFSVPYTVTVTGIGYNKSRVPESALGGWDIFSDPAYAKRSAMLDERREVLGAALKHLSFSVNSTDERELRQAGELARMWRGSAFFEDINAIRDGLTQSSFLLAQGYNGDIAYVIGENSDIGFYVPAEGGALAADVFVIPRDSPLPDLAHAFINHMLDAEMARINMESVVYYMPNKPALERVNPELMANPAFDVSKLINANCEKLMDTGPEYSIYDDIWENVVMR